MILHGVPANPIPDGAASGFLKTPSGERIRYARWRPDGRRMLGTVCLFHGRTEFIEKYFEAVADLRARGFGVATMDWRGQGGSDRPAERFAARGAERWLADLDQFMREVALPDCPPPYYALAHSMGGTILLNALTRRPSYFERAVIAAPMLRIALTQLPHETLRRIAGLMCALGFADRPIDFSRGDAPLSRFEGNRLTSDPARFARTEAVLTVAPQLSLDKPTFGWLRAACAIMDAIDEQNYPARLQTPVLLLGAGADEIVSTRAVERLARRLKNGAVVIVPGAKHELIMERDVVRRQFWGAFDAFVPGSPTFG